MLFKYLDAPLKELHIILYRPPSHISPQGEIPHRGKWENFPLCGNKKSHTTSITITSLARTNLLILIVTHSCLVSRINLDKITMAASHQAAVDFCNRDSPDRDVSITSDSNLDQLANDFSQSLASVASSEVYVSSRPNQVDQQSPSTSTSRKIVKLAPKPLMGPLDRLKTVSDIEACLDSDLHQLNVLNNIEEQWKGIAKNFETVLDHLHECSGEVSKASIQCLESLSETVDLTCNKVDEEMRALYHLMTKCDEMNTKLSVAGAFREEIKTLRKSAETLEHLYKSRPKVVH